MIFSLPDFLSKILLYKSMLTISFFINRNTLQDLAVTVLPDVRRRRDLQRKQGPTLHKDQMGDGLWMDISYMKLQPYGIVLRNTSDCLNLKMS